MSQPVLPMLPAQARSIGASAGLLEGPDGGVVFVFGLATFSYAAGDEAGRRLAAVQLVQSKIALSVDVASAFGVSGVTLWAWGRDYTAGGVAGLLRIRSGPKGPSKLTDAVRAQIVQLDATGLSLLAIAAQTAVSTATVRVALGRVRAATRTAVEPLADAEPATDPADAEPATDPSDDVADDSAGNDDEGAGLVVLAAPAARNAERVAARFGDLTEASVVITEGAQLPLAGLLLALPALEMTGLLQVADQIGRAHV